ncbi:uncharacterized protein Dwil_GK19176 [Drosophila willistoni]|uniref:Thioredoxin domain-containing protein n=1 Tax=Drosophila willistoni TaxID=7260 RepID=B4N880_DROWI|nr:endoplasmic reticulum resident protein 44 [Drosophila willistoni]EDW81331.2 uncharacterized protein Dwil_GK19176 [Drosophila willistoni]
MQLEPIYYEVAQLLRMGNPEQGLIVLGRVDCDVETELAKKYHIRKYPTVAVVQHGLIRWDEFQGPRNVESIMKFLETHLNDPVKEIQSKTELDNLVVVSNTLIIGYFTNYLDQEYKVFRDAVRFFGPYGDFYVVLYDAMRNATLDGEHRIVARAKYDHIEEYKGNKTNTKELGMWIFYQCQPMVQEITFANAEILIDGSLPLMILFHHKDDHESVKLFRKTVESQSTETFMSVRFISGQSDMFSHAMYHMGKSEEDLPFIAFDTFEHMYVLPNFTDIEVPGTIEQYIEDLHSGKLHYKYHEKELLDALGGDVQETTRIPESKFKILKQSKHRYTYVKEEL